MPSPRHDALNRLIRHHPELLVEFLHAVGGVSLPPAQMLSVGPGDLRDRVSWEMHADTVVFDGPPHDRWYSTIVEVETTMSQDKLHQTLEAAEALRLETRKPVYVIFMSPDPKAAAFDEPVRVRSGCLSVEMRPVIVGPEQIPVLADVADMRADLLMAVLSVMAHGHLPEVAAAFSQLVAELPEDDAAYILGYAYDMAVPAARETLEAEVALYISEKSPGIQRVFREGLEQGEARGEVRGEARGQARGEARSILTVLGNRGIEVPGDRHTQIRQCTDIAQLDAWLARSLTATTIDDLFDE